MSMLVGFALPSLVIGLITLGTVEIVLGRTRGRRGTASASPGFEALEVLFAPAKRHEVEERQSRALMRDEEQSGDRPFSRIDLERGKAWIVLNSE